MPATTKRPLRVLMVTGVYPTAAIPHLGTFIKSQAESLRMAGLEVEVIHPPAGWSMPLRYASAALQVFLKTLSGRYDIVHGHYGLWGLTARLQWTTPVVVSFLGDDLLGTPLANGGRSKKDLIVMPISRWLSRVVDAVIVKSEQMKKAAHYEAIFVIPNGVDFELFRPIPRAEARTSLGWDQQRAYVLFGNNPRRPAKNYPLALAAMERLHARGLEAELVVAHGLRQTEVVQYINASNVVMLPSIHEGSPNIVKETMACNVPVVSTNVGDVAQVIGRTKGCEVCAGDPDAFAAGLEEALRHNGPTTGRADIAHLECSVVAQEVIAVYERAMRKRVYTQAAAKARRGDALPG
ncbi:MAG: glycosyltransferase [Chloroflexota bacterium]|nr:glycosyltransferase [Chloroflexota bacterium]